MAKENKIRYGLCNVHIAFIGDGNKYETPIKVPGAVHLTYSAEGDQEGFNADNDPNYGITSSSSSATGNLEMASFPDEVIARMLGWEIDKNGALAQTTDGVPCPFAMMYQVEGDVTPRAGVIYKITASVPEDDNETGTDVKTVDLPYTASVVEMGGRKMAKLTLEKAKSPEAYATFFNSVYEPDFSATPGTPEVEPGTEQTGE